MRGKESDDGQRKTIGRITPAYAGKRNGTHLTMSCCWDHPRLCGEKFAQYDAAFWEWGSPPPMRGKVDVINKLPGINRITPAYAGKSQSKGNAACARKDHPRLCGEKRIRIIWSKNHFRITPAYAGKSNNGYDSGMIK